ncbi:MAG: hypothetical protein JSS97_07275 [Actinobacteria bacterium]|nr:hypothetical protein [Actinomycetota bacterium]
MLVSVVIAGLLSAFMFAGPAASATEKTVCPSGPYAEHWVITVNRGSDACPASKHVMESFLGRSHPSFEKNDSATYRFKMDDRIYIFYCNYFKPKADHGYRYGGECVDGGMVVTGRPKNPVD